MESYANAYADEAFPCMTRGGVLRNRVVLRTAPAHVSIPFKSKPHDCQRRISEVGKCIMENTAFGTALEGGVGVQACRVAMFLELASGRLDLMTTQSS